MGTLILIITLAAEAAFAAYRIVTQSSQRRVGSFLRIGALAAFVLATLFSIIRWSFRWYGLALLLLIWAVLGAWTLIGRKAEKQDYSARRIVVKSIAGLLLVGIVVVPALIFPQVTLPKATGNHPVSTASFTYTDESRIETFTTAGDHRKVNVEFWYPGDGGGPYPLVVFSHGAFGMKAGSTSTFMELASSGYVIASIDHPYHSLYTVDADGNRTIVDQAFLQEVLDVDRGKYDEETVFKLEQKWMALRTADISFVLDTILANASDTESEAVYHLIDPGKIGLMGHSLGGAASAQVARERSDIDAVINLDANLFGEYLDYADGAYVLNDDPYPVPILSIYSDDMVRLMDAVKDADQVIAVKHVTATAPHAYEIHLAGTNHMSLTDLPLISPFMVSLIRSNVSQVGEQHADETAVLEQMNGLVLKFFDAYLKGEGNFSTDGMD